jgi:hypothetical protein
MTIIDPWTNLHSGPSAIIARGEFGNKTTIWKTYGLKVVRCKYYTPTNPRTSKQQANRSKFASAVSMWCALSDEEKASWAKIQKRVRGYRSMNPRNVFIKYYMLDKPLDPTPWWESNGP